MESSPSPSSSTDSSGSDDENEVGWGPLDHLPDVEGTTLGASAGSPTSPGGGGEDALGLAIARPRAEVDAPVAGVPLFGKSPIAAAPEASLLLIFSYSLICVCCSYRG